MTDIQAKHDLIKSYLKAHDLDGIVLSTRANFAWLTGGGDNHVVSQMEAGVGAIYVTSRSMTLVANNIELHRLVNEEIKGLKEKSFPWTQSMSTALAKICAKKNVAGDDAATTGLPVLPGDFVMEVRAQLGDDARRKFRALGRDCSLVIETVARALTPGDSGFQVEADLARHLLARGIQPFVLLVAFDDRLKLYRHPTPTANHLRHHAMIVVCGERHGLIASVTRLVHFGKIPDDLRKRHHSVCTIETAMWQATKIGAAWGDVLGAGIDQYKAEGFAKEWELHHQGGPTGYAGRDIIVTPDEKRLVQPNQAVAWNPSITGTKTEDTFILDENNDREVITACSNSWPTIEITLNGETLARPDILQR